MHSLPLTLCEPNWNFCASVAPLEVTATEKCHLNLDEETGAWPALCLAFFWPVPSEPAPCHCHSSCTLEKAAAFQMRK